VNREPVLLLALVAVLTELGGALVLLAYDHTTAGLLVAAGTFLTGVGSVLARSLVTPITKETA
jgi:energy-converting hydrogenase Eha subunit E